ncbi:L-xylulose reductase-like protein [Leptotrombidium deliense]|uniref:L-xylulose reductase-like protein n=1 Tax=Leptotrombidium deliense TaxID=299467 RepID=A0A443S8N0_9ACAR|nr:L-xylulose reductase-like protein [Leptotrombidium deliense]
MDICLTGKRALVTGAAKGIGKGVAIRLAEYGAEVVAFDKDKESLEQLKNEHPSMEIHLIDISNWENTKKVISQIGPVDLLVNNAVHVKVDVFGNISEDDVDKYYNIIHLQLAVNVKAVINITQEVVKGMIDNKREGCSIVNVSSIAANVAMGAYLVYGATKAALHQITRVSALELGKYQIRVNAVISGPVVSQAMQVIPNDVINAIIGRMPLQRAAQVNDVANLITYLLSDTADMITGACIPIDGGFTAC